MSMSDQTAERASADASAGTAAAGSSQAKPTQSQSAQARRRDRLPRPVKRATYTTLVAAGIPTSWARMLPSFLIVGAQRAGTTSMSRTLSAHPAVFHPVLHQEVHYFDNAYDRGMAWYRSHFPLRVRARFAARAAGAAPMAFESSPYYMLHPLAAERINRDLPGVKLLVLLRDPVERSYSGHAHETALGFETESYPRAIELEESRLAGEAEKIVADPRYYSYSHQHHAYRLRGHYAEQLQNLEKVFGRDRIHVVDSGEFFTDPARIYDGVLDFLGLPQAGHPEFKQRNARPRSAPIPPAVREELEDYFRPHNQQLAEWLGREPSWCR
jgi:hypothetical protein